MCVWRLLLLLLSVPLRCGDRGNDETRVGKGERASQRTTTLLQEATADAEARTRGRRNIDMDEWEAKGQRRRQEEE